MSQLNTHNPNDDDRLLLAIIGVLLVLLAVVSAWVALVVVHSPLGALAGQALNAIFAVGTVQALWYVTRAAGILAYLLLWLSTAWGLGVSSKIFDVFLHRSFTYDLHEFLSLLALGFVALHVAVLVGDRYLPFSVAQVLIPFVAPYRPVWVGIGIIAFYLSLLVSVTFYIRRWIGPNTFRAIHLASFAAYLGGLAHGFFSGTDTPLWSMQLMYGATFLVIVFLTVYWFLTVRLAKKPAPAKAEAHTRALRNT